MLQSVGLLHQHAQGFSYSIHKWSDNLVFSDKDDKPQVPSPAFSLFWLAGDVKEPTHFSQRVGNLAPGGVVWPSYCKCRPSFNLAFKLNWASQACVNLNKLHTFFKVKIWHKWEWSCQWSQCGKINTKKHLLAVLNWNLEFTISLDYMTIYFATIPLSTPSNQESSYCISY